MDESAFTNSPVICISMSTKLTIATKLHSIWQRFAVDRYAPLRILAKLIRAATVRYPHRLLQQKLNIVTLKPVTRELGFLRTIASAVYLIMKQGSWSRTEMAIFISCQRGYYSFEQSESARREIWESYTHRIMAWGREHGCNGQHK